MAILFAVGEDLRAVWLGIECLDWAFLGAGIVTLGIAGAFVLSRCPGCGTLPVDMPFADDYKEKTKYCPRCGSLH